MKRVYITLQRIKALTPCADQFRAAHKLFGKRRRMEVTERRAAALAQKFNFNWLAERTLFGAAHAEYKRVRVSAYMEYDHVKASTWARCYIKQES